MRTIVFLVLLMNGLVVYADELIMSRPELQKMGYLPAPKFQTLPIIDTQADQLQKWNEMISWPVRFQDETHSMGNNMIQYQNYGGGAYYHGGCDLRTKESEQIYAPVSGRVEAYYYSYDRHDNGYMQKYIIPNGGSRYYYEVSIITDEGYRYEIHHIDPKTLSQELKTALKNPHSRIEKGTVLGHVVSWPAQGIDGQYYHHIHFNIIAPDGTILNPEAHAPAVLDTESPHIEKVFAIQKGKSTAVILSPDQKLPENTEEILVLTWDTKNQNVYRQAPSKIEISFENGAVTDLDFIRRLADANNQFPDIRHIFVESIFASDQKTYRTEGNYLKNTFIYRLKIPSHAQGFWAVRVIDMVGNETLF